MMVLFVGGNTDIDTTDSSSSSSSSGGVGRLTSQLIHWRTLMISGSDWTRPAGLTDISFTTDHFNSPGKQSVWCVRLCVPPMTLERIDLLTLLFATHTVPHILSSDCRVYESRTTNTPFGLRSYLLTIIRC